MRNVDFGQGQINVLHSALISTITSSEYEKIDEFLKLLKSNFEILDNTGQHRLSDLKADLDRLEFNYSGSASEALTSMSEIYYNRPAELLTLIASYHFAINHALEKKRNESRTDLAGPIFWSVVVSGLVGLTWWAVSTIHYFNHDGIVSVGGSDSNDVDLKEPVQMRFEKTNSNLFAKITPNKGQLTLRSSKAYQGNLSLFKDTTQSIPDKVIQFETKQVGFNSYEATITTDAEFYCIKLGNLTLK